ncbi:universal stress protein [Ammonifex thiophilus]|uniref:Universal stress protein n=1 Tax=Ammonifex thiophilus TaxID=444093 RepID=A0A3D8P4N3_9THEO|nr:universal stress protein [Ammonifex thiophilus]RDV84190.1 universal stress protein [Ammonifex thiophilus]
MFRRVLVAIDGSEHCYQALRRALEVLKFSPLTQVAVVEVVPPVDPSIEYVPWVTPQQLEEAARKRAAQDLEKALAILREAGIEGTSVIRVGNPAEEIVALAREGNYELIVMGRRGTNPLKELLLGGVSQRVLQLSPVPVFLGK